MIDSSNSFAILVGGAPNLMFKGISCALVKRILLLAAGSAEHMVEVCRVCCQRNQRHYKSRYKITIRPTSVTEHRLHTDALR
jgi:hypothetical protein